MDEEESAPALKRGPFGFLGKKARDVEEEKEEEEEEEEEEVPVPKRQPFSRGSQQRGAAPTPTAPA